MFNNKMELGFSIFNHNPVRSTRNSDDRLEINNSSFNNQLRSTITRIDFFYCQSKSNIKRKPFFAWSYQDDLDRSKAILDILINSPPKDSEELNDFIENELYKLKYECEERGCRETSLLRLLQEIRIQLVIINSNELKENTNILFGQ
ncbi:hypothetical protein [Legionella maioricensis]|uniref:Uncharacterized protein n=1 Tax=Legionella maioricensis TaxID=2896528 RepID=A0A9X2CYT5_9GAMM|nr:hypothetical protein [Legionella maioricensis]MCL9683395.1 hypothetical protein [Legionella maioricensis]MCL9685909.1 hypothetical protein [Legionella maioricensis]